MTGNALIKYVPDRMSSTIRFHRILAKNGPLEAVSEDRASWGSERQSLLVPKAAATKCCRPGGPNNRNALSRDSGGQKSKTKVCAGSSPHGGWRRGWRESWLQAFLLHLLLPGTSRHLLSAHVCVHISLLPIRTPATRGQGPLMAMFPLEDPVEAWSPDEAHAEVLGVGGSPEGF